jgi:hypothetical protein
VLLFFLLLCVPDLFRLAMGRDLRIWLPSSLRWGCLGKKKKNLKEQSEVGRERRRGKS